MKKAWYIPLFIMMTALVAGCSTIKVTHDYDKSVDQIMWYYPVKPRSGK